MQAILEIVSQPIAFPFYGLEEPASYRPSVPPLRERRSHRVKETITVRPMAEKSDARGMGESAASFFRPIVRRARCSGQNAPEGLKGPRAPASWLGWRLGPRTT